MFLFRSGIIMCSYPFFDGADSVVQPTKASGAGTRAGEGFRRRLCVILRDV